MFCATQRAVWRLRNNAQRCTRQFHNTSLTFKCQIWKTLLLVRPGWFPIYSTSKLQGAQICHRCISTGISLNATKYQELRAGPFGELTLRTSGAVSMQIGCLNPNEWPLMDRVVVSVMSEEGVVELGEDILRITQDGNDIGLTINGPQEGKFISCTVGVPVKFDIDADVRDTGDVSIVDLENDNISVQTQQGTCLLKKIQTGTADLTSVDGDVHCEGVLQGNSRIKTTGIGKVKVHRVQSLTFNVQTDLGDIEGKALYADKTEIMTNSGDVHIGSCHRDCSIQASGSSNVTIDSLDGDLSVQIQEGDVGISYVARHESIAISTGKGNVKVELANSLQTKLDLEGCDITLAEDLNVLETQKETDRGRARLTGLLVGGAVIEEWKADLLSSTQRRLVVKTGTGSVNLSCGDWFSSLKLNLE